MRKLALFFILLLACVNLFAQDLYMPRNVKNAYKNGTRSMDGKPGKNYWQNTANYNIKISIDPATRIVTGSEDIVYKNNSPLPIENPVFKMIVNIHRPGAAREYQASPDYLTNGVLIDEFKENDSVRKWNDSGLTTQSVKLSKRLAPGETIKLSFKWHYELSKESNREGMIHKDSYFLAYFYPRVAVFDDIDGWDRTNFTDGHEFYNDFNNYVLEVSVPKNYLVWATGDLLNPDEVLQPEFSKRYKESLTSDKVIKIASDDEVKKNVVTQQSATLTWKFKADNITDVALGTSNNYIWDAGSVIADKTTNRRVSVQAAYNIEAKDFEKMVEYGKDAISWASNNYPGVPYPYSKSIIVRGFADMEYPMMANNSSFPDPVFARFVAEHEIFHTWFPFYMGINEQRYGFMDEGWTTAFEYLANEANMGKPQAEMFFKQFRVMGWSQSPLASSDLPIITPGDSLVGSAVGHNQYGKAAVAYLALRDLMGDAEFKRSLKEFINRWNGKHPLPWDMFNTFNNVSGKNLNWFFQSWFFDNGYVDIAIKEVSPTNNGMNVKLANIGGFVAPVDLLVTFDDGSKTTLHQTPAIWEKNQKETTISIPTIKKIKSITLDGGIFMDSDGSNNSWQQK